MAKSRYGTILAAVCLVCSTAVVVLSRGVERLFDLIVGAFKPQPFLYRDPDELIVPQFSFASPDPHVVRHEAGMATLAAARGI